MLISFWKHHPHDDQTGRLLARKTIQFQQKYHFDYIKVTPAGSWLAACYGLEDAYRGDPLGRRTILRPYITAPQDWLHLADFRRSQPPMLAEQLQAAYLTQKAFPDEPVYITVFSPISQAIQLAGQDQFIQHWQTFPEWTKQGLQILTDNLCYVLEEFKRQAIQHIYYVLQHARQGGLSPHLHRQLSVFTDQTCLSYANQHFQDVIIHLHGADVFDPVGSHSSHTRLHFGASASQLSAPNLLPGLSADQLASCNTLETASQQLRNYYAHPATATATTPHLMADCVLPLDFPDHQINLWTQAARFSSHTH